MANNRNRSAQQMPKVLGGPATWEPAGGVVLVDGEPTWDAQLNAHDGNSVLWPENGAPEVAAVAQAVASSRWAYQGPVEAKLEQRFQTMARAKHSLLVSNGSNALSVMFHAVLAASLLGGDQRATSGVPEFLMPSSTFQATATMAGRCGLKPVPIDVDYSTLTIGVAELKGMVTENTLGVIIVPLYASCPNLAELRAFCDQNGLWLLIDGAHAPFGGWDGQSYAAWADMVSTSNQSSKVLTCGESGWVSTNNDLLAALAMMARNCGRIPEPTPAWWPTAELGDFRLIGDNHRSSELAAALLDAQLTRYPEQQATRETQWARFLDLWKSSTHLHHAFELLHRDPRAEDIFYKAGIRNLSGVPTPAMRRALAEQLTTEVAAPYAPLSDPASGFLPTSEPWQFKALGQLRMDPALFPNAYAGYHSLMMLPHEFFLRSNAAEHLIAALEILATNRLTLANWAHTL